MTVLPPAPDLLGQCRLYELLAAASTARDGLEEKVQTLVAAATPLLDLVIAGPFRQYTLHNPAHSRKLVHLAQFVLPPETQARLTAIDLALFIMASYVHDLGMSVSESDRAALVASEDFQAEIARWPGLREDLETARRQLAHAMSNDMTTEHLEQRIFQLQEAGLASLLRRAHATRERYSAVIAHLKAETGRQDLFTVRQSSFEERLIDVCVSHNEDAGVLLQTSGPYEVRFPRDEPVGGLQLNSQFCAALLRVTDILDFDRERTPLTLFRALGVAESDLPGAPISLREWNKHMAVADLQFTNDELIVHAQCVHPLIEQAVRQFCAEIERELRDTAAVLRLNTEGVLSTYRLAVPAVVRPRITSIGYVYKDLSFTLDHTAISQLLMGEALYASPFVALRELIQNSIDACRARDVLLGDAGYAPTVRVMADIDGDGRTWVEVADNGIGMDEAVLFDYFFRIGRSYYRSAEFERLELATAQRFSPISRFGIGAISVFLLADRLEIVTANLASPRGDTTCRNVRVDNRFGLAFVTESSSAAHGTRVRIRLKPQPDHDAVMRRAATYLRDAVLRPSVPVSVTLGATEFQARSDTFVALRPEATIDLAGKGISCVAIDVGRFSSRVTGKILLFLGVEADGGLNNRPGDGAFNQSDILRVVTGFGGNRITVDGMQMTAKHLAESLDRRPGRLLGVVDVDVEGTGVEYDVGRSRLASGSGRELRNELRRVVGEALAELPEEVRFRDVRYETKPWLREEDLNEKLAAAERAYKDILVTEESRQHWRAGLHQEIAERLRTSGNTAYRLLEILRNSGRIATPVGPRPGADNPRPYSTMFDGRLTPEHWS